MATKRAFADAFQGGISGASALSKFGPYGAVAGGLLGLGGGFLAGQADSSFDELNQQEQGLNNDLLQQKLQSEKRANRQGGMTEAGFNIFRNFLGSAFKANNPASFGAGLKAYPGLGNQGVP